MRPWLEEDAPSIALPTRLRHMNGLLLLLPLVISCIGAMILYSVGGGTFDTWAQDHLTRMALGAVLMFGVAMTPLSMWRSLALPLFLVSIGLLILVHFAGDMIGGARRWIAFGSWRFQPSEFTKISLVLLLAAYCANLTTPTLSRPLRVALALLLIALPVWLVILQPDLGTAALIALGGAAVLFAAGVAMPYFIATATLLGGFVGTLLLTHGTSWQILRDYQYARILTFLDPSRDPLGQGYHITQAKIALGSGGLTGRGFMGGSQSQLNFIPEMHTDFIFTTLAEEMGFVWGLSLLLLYAGIVACCMVCAIFARTRFATLLLIGIATTFFLYFAVNLLMVTGLAPVVGVPLPFLSYGGSAMLTLMFALGLAQSAIIDNAAKGPTII